MNLLDTVIAEAAKENRESLDKILWGIVITEPKGNTMNNKTYEASYYHIRVYRNTHPNLPPDHEDVFCSSRLNDIHFTMPGILEAVNYAKEEIHNPNPRHDNVWEEILSKYFIPFKSLKWEPTQRKYFIPFKSLKWEPTQTESPNDENPFYRCNSKPFKDRNGDKWIIRIRVFPEKKEQAPPGEY